MVKMSNSIAGARKEQIYQWQEPACAPLKF